MVILRMIKMRKYMDGGMMSIMAYLKLFYFKNYISNNVGQ